MWLPDARRLPQFPAHSENPSSASPTVGTISAIAGNGPRWFVSRDPAHEPTPELALNWVKEQLHADTTEQRHVSEKWNTHLPIQTDQPQGRQTRHSVAMMTDGNAAEPHLNPR